MEGWQDIEENERDAVTMDRACTDPAVGRAMEEEWRRFSAHGPHLSTRPSLIDSEIDEIMILTLKTDLCLNVLHGAVMP